MAPYDKLPEEDPSFRLPVHRDKGKRNIFSTPANYFDKLPLEVADKIHSGNVHNHKFSLTSLFTTSRIIGYTVLLVIVIAGSLFLINRNENNRSMEPVLSFDDISNTGLISEMDVNMLFDAYTEIDDFKDSTTIQTDFETTELKEYLIENNTDITLIINEL